MCSSSNNLGFPVISMAIEQSIRLAVDFVKDSQQQNQEKLNFNAINLSNTDQELYQDHQFRDSSSLNNLDKPNWYHYVICSYKGIFEKIEHFTSKNLLKVLTKILSSYTVNLMITGDIPHSSGLSSSSALVVASSIAFRYCLGLILEEYSKENNLDNEKEISEILNINQHEMASDCAFFERYIGTQGGGIDQAIQLLAENGTAKLIKFKPKLDAFNVQLPSDCEFFVLHCGKILNKASTVDYNVRVFETRVAALLLKMKQSSKFSSASKILLSDFESENNYYHNLIQQVNDLFEVTKGRYTINEIQELLKADSYEKLSEMIHFPLKSLNLIIESRGDNFKYNLKDRALHVYNEVNRVLQMQSIDSSIENDKKTEIVGKLLNESHESLKELYECSCDELDKLVELSNLHGAKGAKLTGAG